MKTMKSSVELDKMLMSINRKGYPAYKELKGSYQFAGFVLHIDHVQGDPFAAPSKLSIQVKKDQAGFPLTMYDTDYKRIALQDHLTRLFTKSVSSYTFQAKGSGKSGLIGISRCGQEILERTAFKIENGDLLVRFEVGFPANGRTINAYELKKILFEYLPDAVKKSLFYENINKNEVRRVVELAEDQHTIREELIRRHLVAFVANGSVLPRESGISQRPMKNAVKFQSPASMEVEMKLPYAGLVKGMGIPKGITLIVGGGYHGKSTLLKALEHGIYNHIAGDGREYVITDDTAVKIRAEDGRAVSHVNISPFINDLPNKKNTVDFSTEDASGSTSQAANVVEAVQSGAKTLLIDEDTCATNFMVRDCLMQTVVSGDKEPITPFTLQARELNEKHGISIVLVAGSSGSYFYIADKILQMDNYQTFDITEKVKKVIAKVPEDNMEAEIKIPISVIFDKDKFRRIARSKRLDKKRDQVKIKQFGKDSFSIGKDTVDLKYVEQILDSEQTTTLSHCLKYLLEQMERQEQNVDVLVEKLWNQLRICGLEFLCQGTYIPSGMAKIRKQDIYACVNRYRGLL